MRKIEKRVSIMKSKMLAKFKTPPSYGQKFYSSVKLPINALENFS
jgi:hypothetical protein